MSGEDIVIHIILTILLFIAIGGIILNIIDFLRQSKKQRSNEMNKSTIDIIREMRDGFNNSWHDIDREWARGLADRIEAAHNREKDSYKDTIKPWCDKVGVVKMETTTDENSVVGNGAKMRAAIEAVIEVGYPHNFQRENPNIRGYCYDITKAIKKCFDALAMPPRNCDVGTPREQERRMDEWCHSGKRYYRCLDDGCPNYNLKTNCVFDWLQMPYEEGGAK